MAYRADLQPGIAALDPEISVNDKGEASLKPEAALPKSIDEIRKSNPFVYAGISDNGVLKDYRQEHHPDMPQEEFNKALGYEDPNEQGSISRGAEVAYDQFKQVPSGLLAGAGAGGETLFGEGGLSTAIKKYGLEGFEKQSEAIRKISKPTDSLSYSYNEAINGNPSAMVEWVKYGFGYGGVQMVAALATRGLGTVAGKFVAEVAAKEIVAKTTEKELARLTAENLAKPLALREADSVLAQTAAKKAGENITKWTERAAMGAYTTGMEGSEIGGSNAQKTVERGSPLTPGELGQAAVGTGVAVGLEYLQNMMGTDLILGKGVISTMTGAGGLAARTATKTGVGILGGGLTEFGQTGAERFGEGKPLTGPEAVTEYVDSAGLGGLSEGAAGTVGGLLSKPQAKVTPPPAVTGAGSVDEAIDGANAELAKPLALPHPAAQVGFDRTHKDGIPNVSIAFKDGSAINAREYFNDRLNEHGDVVKAREETFNAINGPGKTPLLGIPEIRFAADGTPIYPKELIKEFVKAGLTEEQGREYFDRIGTVPHETTGEPKLNLTPYEFVQEKQQEQKQRAADLAARTEANKHPIDRLIAKHADAFGVPHGVVDGVATVESQKSQFDEHGKVIRPFDKAGNLLSNAIGTMQIIPKWHRDLAPDLTLEQLAEKLASDTDFNIASGAKILRQNFDASKNKKEHKDFTEAQHWDAAVKSYYGSDKPGANESYLGKVKQAMAKFTPSKGSDLGFASPMPDGTFAHAPSDSMATQFHDVPVADLGLIDMTAKGGTDEEQKARLRVKADVLGIVKEATGKNSSPVIKFEDLIKKLEEGDNEKINEALAEHIKRHPLYVDMSSGKPVVTGNAGLAYIFQQMDNEAAVPAIVTGKHNLSPSEEENGTLFTTEPRHSGSLEAAHNAVAEAPATKTAAPNIILPTVTEAVTPASPVTPEKTVLKNPPKNAVAPVTTDNGDTINEQGDTINEKGETVDEKVETVDENGDTPTETTQKTPLENTSLVRNIAGKVWQSNDEAAAKAHIEKTTGLTKETHTAAQLDNGKWGILDTRNAKDVVTPINGKTRESPKATAKTLSIEDNRNYGIAKTWDEYLSKGVPNVDEVTASDTTTAEKDYHHGIVAIADGWAVKGGIVITPDNKRSKSVNSADFQKGAFNTVGPAKGIERNDVKHIKEAVDTWKRKGDLTDRQHRILKKLSEVAAQQEKEAKGEQGDGGFFMPELSDDDKAFVEKLKAEQEKIKASEVGDAIDYVDSLDDYDALGNETEVDNAELEKFLGIDNEKESGPSHAGSTEEELLTSYTEGELTDREKEAQRLARQKKDADLKAKLKEESDKSVATLEDEMLGIGRTATADIFTEPRPDIPTTRSEGREAPAKDVGYLKSTRETTKGTGSTVEQVKAWLPKRMLSNENLVVIQSASDIPALAIETTPVKNTANTFMGEAKSFRDDLKTKSRIKKLDHFLNRVISFMPGDNNVSDVKGISNTRPANTNFFRNILEREAFIKHGFGGLDVPSQGMMLLKMVSSIHDLKVANAVVESIPVNVMDDLTSEKLALQMRLHDKSMLKNVGASDGESSIPVTVNVTLTALANVFGSIIADTHYVTPSSDNGLGGRDVQASLSPSIVSEFKDTQAFYSPSQNKVYVIADNITKKTLKPVLAHEFLHLAEATDPKLKAAMNRFEADFKARFDLAGKGLGSKIENDAYRRTTQAETLPEDRLVEFRAYLVEEYVKDPTSFTGKLLKIIKDMVAAMRVALLKQGLDFGMVRQLSPADLLAMSRYGTNVKATNSKAQAKTVMASTEGIGETVEVDGRARPTRDSNGDFIHPTIRGQKNFWRWFHGSETVDDQGRPIALYHGTTSDFTVFDKSKAFAGSDLGGGFYFTNTQGDVGDNYAGEGPDMKIKIERLAERYQQELEDEGYDSDEAGEIADVRARQELMPHGGMTMKVYVKMDNPVVLSHSKGKVTFLTYEDNYDNETEDYGEPTGTLVDFIDALNNVEADYDDITPNSGAEALYQEAQDWGGMDALDIIAKLQDAYTDAEDDNGVMVSNEIIRRAFEEAGYDGFIDETVDVKFGSQNRIGKAMTGMNPDTVHYIVLSPENVKSAIGNNGDFDPSNTDIRRSQVLRSTKDTDIGNLADLNSLLATGQLPQENTGFFGVTFDKITDWFVDSTRNFDVWTRQFADQELAGQTILAKDRATRKSAIMEKTALDKFMKPFAEKVESIAGTYKVQGNTMNFRAAKTLVGRWMTARYALQKNRDYLAQDARAISDAEGELITEMRSDTADSVNRAETALNKLKAKAKPGQSFKVQEAALKKLKRIEQHAINGNIKKVPGYGKQKGAITRLITKQALRDNAMHEQRIVDPTLTPLDVGLAGGFNNFTAKHYLDEIERVIPRSVLQDAAKDIYDMNTWKLHQDLLNGKVTQQQITEWNLSPIYVPLTGDPSVDDSTEDMFSHGSLNQTTDHRAVGRASSLSQDGVDASVEQVQKSARYHGWADFKANFEQLYEGLVTEKTAPGMSRSDSEAAVMRDYHISKHAESKAIPQSPSDIIIRRNGVKTVYNIHNQAAVNALKRLNEEQVPGMLAMPAKFVQMTARFVTVFMPMFGLSNAIRDTWEKSENIRFRTLPGYTHVDMNKVGGRAWKIAAQNPLMVKKIMGVMLEGTKFEGKVAVNNADPDIVLLRELIAEGGTSTVGDFLSSSSETLSQQMEESIHWGRELLQAVTAWNNAFELMSSFSVYKALKEQGVDTKTAAGSVLNLMNFNKTGSKTGLLRALYMFVNPTFQGGHQLIQTLSTPGGQRRAMAYLVAGSALYMMLRMMAGDDDRLKRNKLDMQSNSMLERNIMIPLPWDTDTFVKVPMGFGLAQLTWGIATNLVKVVFGDKSALDAGGDIFKSATRTLAPVSPSEASVSEHFGVWLVQTFTPQIAKPIANVAMGRDAFGRDLTNEKFGKSDKPLSWQGRKTTPMLYKQISAQLGQMGIETYPESVREIVNGYLPGVIHEVLKATIENPNKEALGRNTVSPLIDRWIAQHDTHVLGDRLYFTTREKMDKAATKQALGKVLDKEEQGLVNLLPAVKKIEGKANGILSKGKRHATMTNIGPVTNNFTIKRAEAMREKAKELVLNHIVNN